MLAGAIGLDAFAGRAVTLQSGLCRVTVEDHSRLKRRTRHAIPVPIQLVRDAQGAALSVDLGVLTTSGLAWIEIDTGNIGRALISRKLAPLFGLDPAIPALQELRFPFLPGLSLQGRAQGLDLILDGNVGRPILDHWAVTVDLEHQRGWISNTTPIPATA